VNLCDIEELSMLMNVLAKDDWFGRPVWERMPKNESDSGSTETFLGRLTPVSRAIRLFDNSHKMLYGEALRYATYPDFPQEFNTSVVVKKNKKKEDRYLIGAKLNVRPWRQLDAILQYNLPGKTLTHALNLSHLDGEPIDIWVGALIRNPGKQDILDSVESRFHISKQFRTETGCATYATEVQKAQNVSKTLDDAVYLYRKELDPSDGKGLGSTATNHYWTIVEGNLKLLMDLVEAIGSDDVVPAQLKWRSSLFRAAREAYIIACGQETPRQRKAFAKGWQELTAKKEKSDTETNETKEEVV